ncbi:MAG: cbb3-type cytochrome c oxidase subunit I [Caldilineaceae bacterium]
MAVSTFRQPVSAAQLTETTRTIDYRTENKLTGWYIGIGMTVLSVGILIGILQGMEHAGFNLYPLLQPAIKSYYQGLTIHGVLNALVWTTFFIVGFFTMTITRTLGRPLAYPVVNWVGFWLMTVGLVLAAIPLLGDAASVLYTFYPPLKADVKFYLGLTLVVVGSWVAGWGFYFTYWAWKKDNPGVATPFVALASLITMVLWQICTLGVAAEILVFLIPAALNWIPGVDPLLGRTLFWFTGHPLVYFWLLPAYVAWYGMVPKQAGGKLFSGNLARLVFWLFLLLSTPLGFHHQYTDPGIPAAWKYIHALLTFGVAFPSLLTAFTVAASLETGGRARGGKGWFGWIRKLPWNDPSYTAQNFAMILFAFGGISGITNASYNMNLAVHNTTWIPGHFHLTVGSATTLTFFGIAYWMVPKLSGKQLFALLRPWHRRGRGSSHDLLRQRFPPVGSALRRTAAHHARFNPYFEEAWSPMIMEMLLGVALLTISAILFYVVIVGTLVRQARDWRSPSTCPSPKHWTTTSRCLPG